MAVPGALSRHHPVFVELTVPQDTQEGVKSPSDVKARARENLGVALEAGAVRLRQPAPATQDTTATLTTTQMLTGLILSNPGAGQTLTFALGADIDAAVTNPVLEVDDAFEVTVANLSANALTVAVNTGVTNGGSAEDLTIAANASATYRFRKTAANTFTFYRVA